MNYLLRFSAAALGCALFLQQGLATPPPGKLAKIVEQPKAETCGEYGTSVQFEKTPSDAARRALKEEKLVFVLHVSGHFEDPNLT